MSESAARNFAKGMAANPERMTAMARGGLLMAESILMGLHLRQACGASSMDDATALVSEVIAGLKQLMKEQEHNETDA